MHVCSHREQFSDWKDGEERPSALLARRAEEGMEPDDLLCSRNAPGFVCLVGWSVWFFWMNFWSDQPDRRDRPDEPAFVGRAQWEINQPPSLKRQRASLEGSIKSLVVSRCVGRDHTTRLAVVGCG